MAVASAALAMAMGGSAVAASLITSKQIKDGTIQTKDLSKKARAQLKCWRGPTGTTGASGAQGPQGPQGDKGDPGTNGTNGANGAPGSGLTMAQRRSSGLGCSSGEMTVRLWLTNAGAETSVDGGFAAVIL